MASTGKSSGDSILTRKTPILSQKLYVVVIATSIVALAIFLLILFLILRARHSERRRVIAKKGSGFLPLFCKEISEVEELDQGQNKADCVKNRSLDENQGTKVAYENKMCVEIESGSGGKKGSSGSNEFSTTRSESSALSASTDSLGSFGWGRWYSLRELQIATNQFSEHNVIGEGGYGVVYRGVLHDGSVVAVKNLRNNKYGRGIRDGIQASRIWILLI